MAKTFEGKVVIITGSSNGIGRATAVLFAEQGAKVTIHGRSASSLEKSKQDIMAAGASASDIVTVQGDLTEDKCVHEIVDKTVAAFGAIHVLVNNAGSVAPDNTKEDGWDQSMEVYDYVTRLNNRAVVQLTKLCMPHLIEAKGEVINISSICGMPFGIPHIAYYAASKAALDQMTRSLAAFYIGKGVRVNSVNPGIISTSIMSKQGITAERQAEAESLMANDPNLIPIGRVAQSIEIAKVVAFLADRSQSEFIVGQCIVVDGGSTLVTPVLNTYDPTEFK